MGLKKLGSRIYYMEHNSERDRPMLAYVKGDTFSLAIDAGYSRRHVQEFYESLAAQGLAKPDFTVLTHWHFDHTLGLSAIDGVSIAHERTNQFLKEHRQKSEQPDYFERLKNEDEYFRKEYSRQPMPNIATTTITYTDSMALDLGGITAEIFHTEAPHSKDTTCIWIPEEKVLFLGDSTSEDFFNNNDMDRKKLCSLMKRIDSTPCDWCILSHDRPLSKQELLEYLRSIE